MKYMYLWWVTRVYIYEHMNSINIHEMTHDDEAVFFLIIAHNT